MRSFSLHLTERGHNAIPSLIETFREWDEVLSEGFSAEELTVLRGQLKKWPEMRRIRRGGTVIWNRQSKILWAWKNRGSYL